MASIRSKLTWSYTLALMATLFVFSAAILVVRRSSVMRELTATAETYADLSVQILREASTASENVVVTSDSLVGPVLNPRWRPPSCALRVRGCGPSQPAARRWPTNTFAF